MAATPASRQPAIPDPAAELPAMALRLAAQGHGITLATPLMMRFAAPGPAHWRELRDDVTRDLVLIARKDDVDRIAIAVFADALAEVISRSGAGAEH